MGPGVVHDDDIARSEHRHESLREIGAEAFALDRPIEGARCGGTVEAQGGEKGQRAPVAARGEAAQRRNVGLDLGLVDEHQSPRIEAWLAGTASGTVPIRSRVAENLNPGSKSI